jgi:hypothetical protein
VRLQDELHILKDNIKHILKNQYKGVDRIHMAHFCGSSGRLL